jgi:hypothetical protein
MTKCGTYVEFKRFVITSEGGNLLVAGRSGVASGKQIPRGFAASE